MNSISVKAVTSCVFMLCVLPVQSLVYAQSDSDLEVHTSEHHTTYQATRSYNVFKPVPAEPYWYVQTSAYTKHFKPKSQHNNHQELIGLERHTANSYVLGGATFLNSYDQRSFYGYVGKRFDFADTPFYGKLTAGLIHGYKGRYRDKIPLNRFEIAPAVIPALGVQYRRVSAEVLLLGTAATMINVGVKL